MKNSIGAIVFAALAFCALAAWMERSLRLFREETAAALAPLRQELAARQEKTALTEAALRQARGVSEEQSARLAEVEKRLAALSAAPAPPPPPAAGRQEAEASLRQLHESAAAQSKRMAELARRLAGLEESAKARAAAPSQPAPPTAPPKEEARAYTVSADAAFQAEIEALFPSTASFWGFDRTYWRPGAEWLERFHAQFWQWSSENYVITRERGWDCDDWAAAYRIQATLAYAKMPSRPCEGIAVGEVRYQVDADRWHCLNVVCTPVGLVFVEPQKGRQVHLSEEQRASISFVRF